MGLFTGGTVDFNPPGAISDTQTGTVTSTAGLASAGSSSSQTSTSASTADSVVDFSVASSAYGTVIPIIYGTMRVSLNILWSEGIEEVPILEEVVSGGGGKGGRKPTTKTYVETGEYYYVVSMACGICEGEVDDVIKMWADGTLIYDKSGGSDTVKKSGLNFRFYPGSETQEPDPLIQAAKGEESTPAFRGLSYIVFDKLPIEDYGNRVPAITVEVTSNVNDPKTIVSSDMITTGEGGLSSSFDVTFGVPDFDRGYLYLSANGDNIIRRINIRTMVEDRQKETSIGGRFRPHAVTPEGYILAELNIANKVSVGTIDPNSLEILNTFGTTSNSFPTTSASGLASTLNHGACWVGAIGPNGTEYFVIMTPQDDVMAVLRVTGGACDYVWSSNVNLITVSSTPDGSPSFSSLVPSGCCTGPVQDGFGVAYARMSDSNYFAIYQIVIRHDAERVFQSDWEDGGSTTSYVKGISANFIAEFEPSDLISGASTLTNVSNPVYDKTDNNLIFSASLDGTYYAFKLDLSDGSILWTTAVPSGGFRRTLFHQSVVEDGVIAAFDTDRAYALRTSDGAIIYDDDTWDGTFNSSGFQLWNSRTNSILSVPGSSQTSNTVVKWQLFRGSGSGATVSSIIQDLCERVNISSSDIDVTDWTSTFVPGYILKQQTAVRQAIAPLSSIYFFDVVESDYTLKFPDRDGKSPSAYISYEDMVPSSTGNTLVESRKQDPELPMRYYVTYLDASKDYDQSIQSDKRTLQPLTSMYSRNETNISVTGMSLDADTAKQSAQKGLYSEWVGRSSFKGDLPWTYLALDPADIVQFTMEDGTIFRNRLTSIEVGADFTMSTDSIAEDTAQYTSTITADTGSSGLTNTFRASVLTRLILLSSPLLKDADDTGRNSSILYYLMGGYGDEGWRSAGLYKSSDNSEYGLVGTSVNEVAWGTASNALGDTDTPGSTDEVNTLTVYMNVGADRLSSVTQLEMLNGANAAALIRSDGNPEIIQFRDVTVNDNGSVTLGGLLRGRRGTEVFTGSHAAGDTFILLQSGYGAKIALSLGEQDATRYYKAVSSGQTFERTLTTSYASPMNDLKPYAVVNHKAILDGSNNITISWLRRTRIGGELKDYVGLVPINEDSEEYEIEIFSGPTDTSPTGTLVRTVTGLGSSGPEYTYSAADQATDGFSVPLTEITVKIYQISAQVGRGFAVEKTIEVT